MSDLLELGGSKGQSAAALDALLAEQSRYYDGRAPEYDEWFHRRGRYDQGPERNALWHAEMAALRDALRRFAPAGEVLELACGTGIWTQHIADHARRITAVDASAEMLRLNRVRMAGLLAAEGEMGSGEKGAVERGVREKGSGEKAVVEKAVVEKNVVEKAVGDEAIDAGAIIEYQQADLFQYRPTGRYDAVCFAFWLSHVPEARFEAFWAMVRDALAPDGRVFFADSLPAPSSMAIDQEPLPESGQVIARSLNDGRRFQIVKVFHEPEALARRLEGMGWEMQVAAIGQYFYVGQGRYVGG
jgi:demethylmenaquinone methyltransferase/2-methoxy-6-polyprenyl-1,4-benzoquinol methylase